MYNIIKMTMNRNQYIKIDKSIEEICKMEIDFDDYDSNDRIEDLEIVEGCNVLIYKSINREEDYENIYRGIKIMITTINMVYGDRYRKLPRTIEYIVINKKIYRNDEYDMMEYMTYETFERYVYEDAIREKIYEDEEMRIAINGCIIGNERAVIDIIRRLEEREDRRYNYNYERLVEMVYKSCFMLNRVREEIRMIKIKN